MAFKVVQLLAFCVAVANARAPSKIVNGQDAWYAEFPHQVSLQMWDQHFCGGSILDSTHILTAAHCVTDADLVMKKPEDVEVVTGTIETAGRTSDNVFPVIKITRHGQYNPKNQWANDIAILKLGKPIPFNAYQSPIRLPTRDTPAGTIVTASGWGASEYRGQASQSMSKLQKLQTRVMSLEDCRYQMGDGINPGQICVLASKTSGVCVGDSGGPITSNGEVVGVASFVVPCGQGYPDVFTRVYYYVSWIRNQLRY